jgi:hypothetical protein
MAVLSCVLQVALLVLEWISPYTLYAEKGPGTPKWGHDSSVGLLVLLSNVNDWSRGTNITLHNIEEFLVLDGLEQLLSSR